MRTRLACVQNPAWARKMRTLGRIVEKRDEKNEPAGDGKTEKPACASGPYGARIVAMLAHCSEVATPFAPQNPVLCPASARAAPS